MYEQDVVRLLTADHPNEAIRAAADLVLREIGGPGGRGALLPWAVRATDDGLLRMDLDGWPAHGEVTLDEARSAYGQGTSLAGLLLTRAVKALLGDNDDVPGTGRFHRSIEAVEGSQRRIQDIDERVFVEPPNIPRVRKLLGRHGFAGLVGVSASGKTVLADTLSKEYQSRGRSVRWIDLTDPDATPLGCLVALMRTERTDAPSLIVLDDVQSNPASTALVLEMMRSAEYLGHRHVLALGWLDARDLLERHIGVGRVLVCDGKEVCKRIVLAPGVAGEEARHELLGLARSNALIAETAVSMFYDSGRAPRQAEIARRTFEVLRAGRRLYQSELRVLWLVSCLAMFEIDLNLTYVDQETRDIVGGLLSGRILRRRGDYVSFGHRTFARFVVRHMREARLVDAASTAEPVSLAVAYLRAAGDLQIQITLDRLDLLSLEIRDDTSREGAFLAEAWASARVLARYIVQQIETDPSWGDNVASAIFAAEAMAALGMTEEWRRIARYIRSRWLLPPDAKLPQHTEGTTAESVDFAEIIKKMAAEDATGKEFPVKAGQIDVDRFHRTWVLGLLMGFEGIALDPDESRIRSLRRMVAAAQQPDGSFYPTRVPWITARVCLGLLGMGETLATSNVLRDSVRWLLTEAPAGPLQGDRWQGGTGAWNTEVNTTALVLLALATAGVERDERVGAALAFIRSVRRSWLTAGQEVDCAQALEASLMLGESWASSAEILNHLISWAKDSRSWEDAVLLASQTQDESGKVPYVARALITIVWEMARAELPSLLEGMTGEELKDMEGLNSLLVKRDQMIADAQAGLERLSQFILVQIRDREVLLSRDGEISEISANWHLWRSRATECERLLEALGASANSWSEAEVRALIAEINEFGRAMMGASWETVDG